MLVVTLETVEYKHLRPYLGVSVLYVFGTEVAVGALRGKDRLYPRLSFGGHGAVAQYVGQTAVAAEPVGRLLPAVVRAGHEPCVVALVEPGRDFGEVAVEAVALQFELLFEPAFGLDGAEGQFFEGKGRSAPVSEAAAGRSTVDTSTAGCVPQEAARSPMTAINESPVFILR